MFNIGCRKVGGIYFWNVGRICGSVVVQTEDAFFSKIERQCEAEAMKALASALN